MEVNRPHVGATAVRANLEPEAPAERPAAHPPRTRLKLFLQAPYRLLTDIFRGKRTPSDLPFEITTPGVGSRDASLSPRPPAQRPTATCSRDALPRADGATCGARNQPKSYSFKDYDADYGRMANAICKEANAQDPGLSNRDGIVNLAARARRQRFLEILHENGADLLTAYRGRTPLQDAELELRSLKAAQGPRSSRPPDFRMPLKDYAGNHFRKSDTDPERDALYKRRVKVLEGNIAFLKSLEHAKRADSGVQKLETKEGPELPVLHVGTPTTPVTLREQWERQNTIQGASEKEESVAAHVLDTPSQHTGGTQDADIFMDRLSEKAGDDVAIKVGENIETGLQCIVTETINKLQGTLERLRAKELQAVEGKVSKPVRDTAASLRPWTKEKEASKFWLPSAINVALTTLERIEKETKNVDFFQFETKVREEVGRTRRVMNAQIFADDGDANATDFLRAFTQQAETLSAETIEAYKTEFVVLAEKAVSELRGHITRAQEVLEEIRPTQAAPTLSTSTLPATQPASPDASGHVIKQKESGLQHAAGENRHQLPPQSSSTEQILRGIPRASPKIKRAEIGRFIEKFHSVDLMEEQTVISASIGKQLVTDYFSARLGFKEMTRELTVESLSDNAYGWLADSFSGWDSLFMDYLGNFHQNVTSQRQLLNLTASMKTFVVMQSDRMS